MAYKKKCVYCGADYESESRNQRYCSEECCQKAQEKNYKQKKTRARKRREYDRNKEINRGLSQAYSLAHRVAELWKIPMVCTCVLEGQDIEKDPCSGDLELHHKDGNPFNNAPWNLGWYCNHHHSVVHTQMEDINVVEVYSRLLELTKYDVEPYLNMVAEYQDIIRKAGNKDGDS